ncbi:response regulator [Phenylobacterium sp. LjRoot225]|uniref:response regulator n=1 Tax=Phenylobacterium sp. LjRoot225 TaxID=3342285 RepID=UPI003ECF0576
MATDALILVVDDDPEACALVTAALDQAGLPAISTGSGQAALALVAEARPSLVVLDAVMDGLSGFETCRRLKAMPDSAHLPVIFITGLSETEHVVEGLRAGGVDYVTKPIVLEELVARVRVHLANARYAESARMALDVAGRSLFAVETPSGALLWRTPAAAELLAASFPGAGAGLPPEIAQPVAAMTARPPEPGTAPIVVVLEGRRLEVAYLGSSGKEAYFRLSESVQGREADILRSALQLTQREAEVLVWIAHGKPNRDISEILNISPRTVNKHLEQVFSKLGVENRAAAAAIATRVVAARN